MSPGSGVGPTRRANNLLLIFLPLTSAVVGSAGRGNVGEYLITVSKLYNIRLLYSIQYTLYSIHSHIIGKAGS